MGLIRTVCLGALVVAVLPTDKAQQAQLQQQAGAAIKWVGTFCTRNANYCETGGQVWGAFVEKAQFGAGMVADMIRSSMSDPETPPAPRSGEPGPGPRFLERDTLSARDREPQWRGAVSRSAGKS